MIAARVVLDSISPLGIRLTTMECTFHRFILSEFNTHRAFSRNSASSRAIPVTKTLAQVTANTAIPLVFPKEQPGMSGGEPLEFSEEALKIWLSACDAAASHAEQLAALGVHKSVVNRIIEPYMWHTVVVSATAYDNFFIQRMMNSAQPEMVSLAYRMNDALRASSPTAVDFGGWHLPYVSDREQATLTLEQLKELSVARVAGVSYNRLNQVRELALDFKLYARLYNANPRHESPFEHVATPSEMRMSATHQGNFAGWHQLRHLLDDEVIEE